MVKLDSKIFLWKKNNLNLKQILGNFALSTFEMHMHSLNISVLAVSKPSLCVGTSPWYRSEHSLLEWPILAQLVRGACLLWRCDPWSGWWDPGCWVMVDICNQVCYHWQYSTSARNSCKWEVRIGPTWSIGWSGQAQESTIIVLLNHGQEQVLFVYIFLY